MGQQQLLLIIVAVIVVGIAIAISIQLFRENAISSKRDMLVNECNTLGSIAIAYYKRPVAYGGGGNSFIGWEIPVDMVATANGNYTATVTNEELVIIGTGTEVVTGTDSIQVKATISRETIQMEILR